MRLSLNLIKYLFKFNSLVVNKNDSRLSFYLIISSFWNSVFLIYKTICPFRFRSIGTEELDQKML